MMKLALVGKGIQQSQSPDLHQRLGRLLDWPTQYDLADAALLTESFPAIVQRLQQAGFRGVNVTYPFKEQARQLASRVSEGVQRVGSANTLLFDGNEIRAENTDYSGFISAYHNAFSTRPPGRVLLVGAGGVGRAIACALGALRVEHLAIIERDPERGEALCRDLLAQGIPADVVSAEQADQYLAEYDGVVNCTPVGHLNHPGCPVNADLLHSEQWVFDAVYIPARTLLLAAAESAGAATLSGVDLFVFQGVDAFRFFAEGRIDEVLLNAHLPAIRAHYIEQLIQRAEMTAKSA